jgi:uncharacterized membrane protein YoaK (UPF0700 family)
MFRHKGETRTLEHNLRIASLLSSVAGLVNVTGFLAVQRLTTNVTGHFAFFVDEIFKLNFIQAFAFFLYIFFFLLGSFMSNFLVELIHKRNAEYAYMVPAIIESIILVSIGVLGQALVMKYPNMLAYILLFTMGMQNSLVTKISNAAVRTTHLTGLFTDLGIELSQLFFYRQKEHRQKLYSSIRLRLTIITFFFLGGIAGAVFYSGIKLHVLLIAGIALVSGVAVDYVRSRKSAKT